MVDGEDEDFASYSFFIKAGAHILQDVPSSTNATNVRRFRSMFGATPTACALLLALLARRIPNNCNPYHLLWGLIFLKCIFASLLMPR